MTDINQQHPPHDHERSDVHARVLIWAAIALVLLVVLSIPLMIGVFKLYQWDEKTQPVLSPLAINQQPPAPTLQSVPALELTEYRRQQHELLGHYDWVDRQQQIVRIPIAEATRLLVERGLPKAPPPPPAPQGETGSPAQPSAQAPAPVATPPANTPPANPPSNSEGSP